MANSSRAAYNIAAAAAAARVLLQSFADADDDTREIIIDTETDLPTAMSAALNRLAEVETFSDALAARANEIRDRVKRFDDQATRIRAALTSAMSAVGMTQLEIAECTVSLRPTPPSVVITDDGQLPPEYTRQRIEPDKARIKVALASGQAVPGAQLSNGGVTVAIRRR